VNWEQFERIGVTRESLEKSGNMDKLLNRQKTDLMPIPRKEMDFFLFFPRGWFKIL